MSKTCSIGFAADCNSDKMGIVILVLSTYKIGIYYIYYVPSLVSEYYVDSPCMQLKISSSGVDLNDLKKK